MVEKICGSILCIVGMCVLAIACDKQNICTVVLGSTWMICGTLLVKGKKDG